MPKYICIQQCPECDKCEDGHCVSYSNEIINEYDEFNCPVGYEPIWQGSDES